MSVGSWRVLEPLSANELTFPGLSLSFRSVIEGGRDLVIDGRVVNLPRLWEHRKFRYSGWAEYHNFLSISYPIEVRVRLGGELVSLSFIDRHLRVLDLHGYFNSLGDVVKGELRGLVERVLMGRVDYRVTEFTPIYVTEIKKVGGGLSFKLELFLPVILRVKVFVGDRTKLDLDVHYRRWVERVGEYNEVLKELAEEFFSYGRRFISKVDFREVFPSLPDEAEVEVLVGVPERRVDSITNPFTYVYSSGSKDYLVTSPTVGFRLVIPWRVCERFGLDRLLLGMGDPMKILSLLGFIVSLFPSVFVGDTTAKRLFLLVVSNLVDGGEV